MAPAKVQATFSIPRDLLDVVATALAQGAAPSQNALIEQALWHELRAIHQYALAAQWARAASDPLILRAVKESEAFSLADAETA